jgi:hypothetical protein
MARGEANLMMPAFGIKPVSSLSSLSYSAFAIRVSSIHASIPATMED